MLRVRLFDRRIPSIWRVRGKIAVYLVPESGEWYTTCERSAIREAKTRSLAVVTVVVVEGVGPSTSPVEHVRRSEKNARRSRAAAGRV